MPLFGLTFGKNNIVNLPANTTSEAVANGNWIFLKPLPIGKHIIYFKGGLEACPVSTNTNNTVDAAFAGPYDWDNPVTYHVTITNSSSFSSIPVTPPLDANQTQAGHIS